MQGFALRPRTYHNTVRLLAERCRVLVPALFDGHGARWSPDLVLADLEATLDDLGLDTVTMVGHSFGGALELLFAASRAERVTELVFADTLAMSREWTLAAEAVHPVHLLWMATPGAALDFATSALAHPLSLAQAGWWGFRSDRRHAVDVVAATGIACHVLWADRDSLLSRSDGAAFARDLGADFTVVHSPSGAPVDHDWIYRHPPLLPAQLHALGVRAWTGAPTPGLTNSGAVDSGTVDSD